MRQITRRGPVWRCADRAQTAYGYASLKALRSDAGFPDPPVSLTLCPYLSSVLPTSPTASPHFAVLSGGGGSPVALLLRQSSAQTMRAILLASATATSILGLRARAS